jgi:hypothetical protein
MFAGGGGVTTTPLLRRTSADQRYRQWQDQDELCMGFPGWEQHSATLRSTATSGPLELLCAAFGGSDPSNRRWATFFRLNPETQRRVAHARAALANVVGVVHCCANHLHFEMGSFCGTILSELRDVLGAARFAQLPIAVLAPRRSHRGVPEGAFAWRLFPDVVSSSSNPARIFLTSPDDRREVRRWNVLLWIYRTRLELMERRGLQEVRDPAEDPPEVRRGLQEVRDPAEDPPEVRREGRTCVVS